jgi:hypothetical protein
MSEPTTTLGRQAVRNPGDLSKPENLAAFVHNINQALFNLSKRTTVNLAQVNQTLGDGWTTILDDGTNLIKFQYASAHFNVNINGTTTQIF